MTNLRSLASIAEYCVGLLLWLAAAPLILLLMAAVCRFIGSPVFFKQWRPGYKGRPFKLIKFRTMTDARDPNGNLLPDEQRMTPFGQILRTTSLDELPELFNVFKGEMRLVGPRPLLMEYLDRYSPEQGKRHDVLPGITGWAQINGRNAISWEDKFSLDVWYVQNRTILLDLHILAKTVSQTMRREGISQPGHITAEKFNPSQNGLA